MLKVWEVTPEKHFPPLQFPHWFPAERILFSQTCFFFFFAGQKMGRQRGSTFSLPVSHFLHSLIVLVRTKGFYPRLVLQTLMECNLHAFCCFKPKPTAFLSQHLSKAAWGENKVWFFFFSAQDELMSLANYFCTFCRVARIKVIAENERTGPP